MDVKELEKKIAYLEFVNDQLLSEIQHVDTLLRDIGFCDGLSSIKHAAEEIAEDEDVGE
jgi:hypothetical protein